MSNPTRPIVRAAFRCDALVYQFEDIDTSDGVLPTGSMADVAAAYSDDGLIREAENWLDICQCNLEDLMYQRDSEDYQVWEREAKQLRAFIKKWGA